jgi:hypothetical protein
MSRYEAEPEHGSSRTLTVVLLSLLILTVIGALFGYVLGLRYIDEDKSTAGDGPSAVGATSATGGTKPGAGPPPRDPCPGFIGDAVKQRDAGAGLPLYLVLYVRTDANQEVWICQEADRSGLWYQGHEKRASFYDDGEIPKDGDNGLLLGGVTGAGSGRLASYTAVNVEGDKRTTYKVSRDALIVSGNQSYSHKVIQANPPA